MGNLDELKEKIVVNTMKLANGNQAMVKNTLKNLYGQSVPEEIKKTVKKGGYAC